MVAQIDEQHAAMIALAVDPAGQADGLADVGGAKRGAVVGAIGVHDRISFRHGLRGGARQVRAGARFPCTPPFVNARAPALWTAAMHIHPLITDSADRSPISAPASPQSPFVAVDTEFMRESTYLARALPDPDRRRRTRPRRSIRWRRGIDLKPLLDLLVDNEDVLKVFHAGGQDIEIVYNLTGKTPHPLFDTQVAAMALGQGEQIGYSNLVDSWLGIQVDKGARFTDWARRPLDERQIEYAIGDVTHLADDLPQDARRAAQDRARRVARPGDGAARRSGQLRQRSRSRVEARPHRRAASPTCSAG